LIRDVLVSMVGVAVASVDFAFRIEAHDGGEIRVRAGCRRSQADERVFVRRAGSGVEFDAESAGIGSEVAGEPAARRRPVPTRLGIGLSFGIGGITSIVRTSIGYTPAGDQERCQARDAIIRCHVVLSPSSRRKSKRQATRVIFLYARI